jgi:hypothetical protein
LTISHQIEDNFLYHLYKKKKEKKKRRNFSRSYQIKYKHACVFLYMCMYVLCIYMTDEDGGGHGFRFLGPVFD